jgi:Cys-rich four helix bundle protein (predicted Tat secretion target)
MLSATGGLLGTITPTFANAEDHAKHAAHGQHHDLVNLALHCVAWGQQCQKHIMSLFASGDTSLAQCSVRVQDMVAVCNALASLAAAESDYLKPLAKVCIEVCESCEKECRKHESQHAICKETADSCMQVVTACKKLVA